MAPPRGIPYTVSMSPERTASVARGTSLDHVPSGLWDSRNHFPMALTWAFLFRTFGAEEAPRSDIWIQLDMVVRSHDHAGFFKAVFHFPIDFAARTPDNVPADHRSTVSAAVSAHRHESGSQFDKRSFPVCRSDFTHPFTAANPRATTCSRTPCSFRCSMTSSSRPL